ncbi:MAG: hydrogenase iron-sulfur subunit [Deltaproteobacteria bacterium]|nr:hydrogenase iron-sulfur subunit [Deltaproteobacteria bacterium]MBW2660834.1 hydrogenase iron-sulfur subunit [Deltaproteobacteria bacterium]
MNNYNIILMLCNWGAHSAYQTLQDTGAEIPSEINMVRIPCTGRISKSLLFKAFEMGADGVALVGCEPGTCRYGSGTAAAIENTGDMRGILDLLGLGKDRLRLATFLPDDSGPLLKFLKDFCSEIRALGKSPVTHVKAAELESVDKEVLSDIVSAHDVFACQDCGKCTSACPLTLAGKQFSPRALVGSVIAGDIDLPNVQEDIWACLTCGLCYDRCPSAVNFPEFIRDLRHFSRERNMDGHMAHGGFFQSLMRAMTSPRLKARRWDWLPDNVRIDNKSKILFFGGCAPYFDIFFRSHLGVQTCNIITDSLRLLNFFDIQPALLQDERCCGHDLLWSGDKDNFLKLARLNVDLIHSLGIEEVVTACPECYRTLVHDYEKYGIKLNCKVTHIYDLLETEIDKGAVDFKKIDKRLTFQDPCRLSRFEQREDLPRMLLKRLKPNSFQEMSDKGSAAICCGNSAWTGCDSFSKALQVKRLKQARETESDLLVTACPKCQIHLQCAMEDPFLGEELKMEMMDLTGLLAKTICWE